MKKFKFRLESVLNYREQIEDQKRIAMAKVQRVIVDEERKLTEAHRALEEAREEIRRSRTGEIDVAASRRQMTYVSGLKERVSDVLKGLRKLEQELNRKREELVQARKDHKVLEMLKRRRLVEYVKDAEHADQAQTDDLVNTAEATRRAER
jgi:flagellar FliJ protein